MDLSLRESIGDGNHVDVEIVECPKSQKNIKNDKGLIAIHLQTQTEDATHLCIYTPMNKVEIETDNAYAIGGTYNKEKEDLWFFFNSVLCHGNNYLLKLFVVARKDEMKFSLFLPSTGHDLKDRIITNESEKNLEITGSTKEYEFSTSQKDEIVFIKTYRFTLAEMERLEDLCLLMPCSIQIHSTYRVHKDVLKKIKLQYTVKLNEALYKTRGEGDFFLKSASGKIYPVHLFVAAAHSPVLRKAIKNNINSFTLNLSNDDVEMVVAFLYSGSIDNLKFRHAPKLLEIANMLELPGLLKLGQVALSVGLTKENAIDVAILAKKYNLTELSLKVFQYIKQNPELLLDSSIECLNDIDLMRSILQHVGNCACNSRSQS